VVVKIVRDTVVVGDGPEVGTMLEPFREGERCDFFIVETCGATSDGGHLFLVEVQVGHALLLFLFNVT
jgi:hypothetical protein